MFLVEVVDYRPALYVFLGCMFCSTILGLILYFLRVKNIKKALAYVKEKQYMLAIERLNKNMKKRLISIEERSMINLYLAIIGLLMSKDEQFLDHISQVTFRKHLMIRSFWGSIYYLEKEDTDNYTKSKESITKNYQSNYKSKLDTQESLERYLLILNTLEEENQEKLRNIYQQIPDQKLFLKEYLSKFL